MIRGQVFPVVVLRLLAAEPEEGVEKKELDIMRRSR
jgi:hypothetical protein